MANESCENCRFWKRCPDEDEAGICRRYPESKTKPRIYWCGEWRKNLEAEHWFPTTGEPCTRCGISKFDWLALGKIGCDAYSGALGMKHILVSFELEKALTQIQGFLEQQSADYFSSGWAGLQLRRLLEALKEHDNR